MDGDSQSFPIQLAGGGFGTDVTPSGFFAPVNKSQIDTLLEAWKLDRARIKSVSEMAGEFLGGMLTHFMRGNLEADSRIPESTVAQLFEEEGAAKHLSASYWHRALMMTDVIDHMPQSRRDAWNESIRRMDVPEFTEKNVIPTIVEMLNSRERFLAERVDLIFRELSSSHVTNRPEGFSKRMIIACILSFRSVCYRRAGIIHDLRCVIARFMGRDQPQHRHNHELISRLEKSTGVWHVVDGGALRLRLYKCGTAHIEVHPEIAARLNAVLAYIHPAAIPAEFRTPKRAKKTFAVLQRPIPFSVLDELACCTWQNNQCQFGYQSKKAPRSPAVLAAIEVLETIGGILTDGKGLTVSFDFDAQPVVKELLLTGVVPDARAYQFYPTPDSLADEVVSELAILPADECLEPSAGTGTIASRLPVARTTCVELSKLRCKILEARGFQNVIAADFIEWAEQVRSSGRRWNKIAMNPPFSEGRAKLHLEAALQLLAPGGSLCAVLPASFYRKAAPAGFTFGWKPPRANLFADTTVAVTVLTARRI